MSAVTEQSTTVPRKLALGEAGARLAGPWLPAIVGDVNDAQVKLARFEGAFDWHSHEREDEGFLVLRGRIALDFRDGTVELGPSDFLVVPRGVEHRPRSVTPDALVLMVEPSTTLNTGTSVTERTVTHLERL